MCSVKAQTCFAPAARSMAPPTPGGKVGLFVVQLARSPFSDTSKAPNIAISICPPLIIANASECTKYEPPLSMVIGCFPALTKSKSSSPSSGRGPKPNTPFSLWRSTSLSEGIWSAQSVGIPIPRFT